MSVMGYIQLAVVFLTVIGTIVLLKRVILSKLCFALGVTALAVIGLLKPPPAKETAVERKIRTLEERVKKMDEKDPAYAEVKTELEEAKKVEAEYKPEEVERKIGELKAKLPSLAGEEKEKAERELRLLTGMTKQWYDRLPFKLGLDLRGGTEVRLRLKPDDSRRKKLEEQLADLEKAGKGSGKDAEELRAKIVEEKANLETNLNDAADVIRARINNSGLAEIPVTRQGNDKVLVQLPGMDSSEARQLISRIQRLGNLEFRLVVSGEGNKEANQRLIEQVSKKGYEKDTFNFCAEANRVLRPDEIDINGRSKKYGSMLYDWLKTPDKTKPDGTVVPGRFHLVEKEVQLTGERIIAARAQPSFQSPGSFEINISHDNVGSKIFERVTAANVGRQLAIVLDGKLKSAPVLQEAITGGHARITGDFSAEESNDLAVVLKSGSLKVNIEKEYENTVGPTLGEDSIRRGIEAMAAGLVLVIGFMVVYYLLAGVVTDIALFLNMILIVWVLVATGATLTLPGIAGLILTVGMAVDANVLIFERIREEREKGNSLVRSISLGYERAFVTILDANVTTFLTAIILHSFGTESVKGFALTLMIGIVTSMFCSLVITRWIFEALIEFKGIQELKMMRFFKRPSIDFIGMRRPAFCLSIICIAVGMGFFIMRGERNYGHEFTGGTLAHITLEKPMSMEDARKASAKVKKEFEDVGIQSFGEPTADGFDNFVLRTKLVRPEGNEQADGAKGIKSAEEFKTAISAAFPLEKEGLAVGNMIPERSNADTSYFSATLSMKEERSPKEVLAILKEQSELVSPVVVKAGEALPGLPASRKARIVFDLDRTGADGKALADENAWKDAFKKALAASAKDLIDAQSGIVSFKASATPSALADKVRLEAELSLLKDSTSAATATALVDAGMSDVSVEVLDAPAAPKPGEEKSLAVTVLCGVPTKDATGEARAIAAQQQFVRDQFRRLRREGVLDFTEPFPRFTSVGPVVATEMKSMALLALLYAMVVIFFYIWLRFQFRATFGLGAVAALVHDVLFTLGMLAIFDELGIIDGQIDLTIVAALLTIVGYSLNDTIVVFDRIRENLHTGRSLEEIINNSVNQTISRTIITSLTTLLVVAALLFWGGGVIRGFAFSLFVGVFVGTYSSIFIASPLLVEFARKHVAKMAEKEGEPAAQQ